MDTEELFYPEISAVLGGYMLRHDRPGLINGIRELCFCDPGLGQTIGDDLLPRSSRPISASATRSRDRYFWAITACWIPFSRATLRLIQGNDVDSVLEAVGLFLLRFFAPIENASRKEKPVLDAPDPDTSGL